MLVYMTYHDKSADACLMSKREVYQPGFQGSGPMVTAQVWNRECDLGYFGGCDRDTPRWLVFTLREVKIISPEKTASPPFLSLALRTAPVSVCQFVCLLFIPLSDGFAFADNLKQTTANKHNTL